MYNFIISGFPIHFTCILSEGINCCLRNMLHEHTVLVCSNPDRSRELFEQSSILSEGMQIFKKHCISLFHYLNMVYSVWPLKHENVKKIFITKFWKHSQNV